MCQMSQPHRYHRARFIHAGSYSEQLRVTCALKPALKAIVHIRSRILTWLVLICSMWQQLESGRVDLVGHYKEHWHDAQQTRVFGAGMDHRRSCQGRTSWSPRRQSGPASRGPRKCNTTCQCNQDQVLAPVYFCGLQKKQFCFFHMVPWFTMDEKYLFWNLKFTLLTHL